MSVNLNLSGLSPAVASALQKFDAAGAHFKSMQSALKSVAAPGTQVAKGAGLPLSGDAFANLAERRRNAARVFQEAIARGEQQRGQVESRTALSTADLERQFQSTQEQLFQELGAFGAARSPRQAGRPVREMRNQLGAGLGSIQAERAELLAMIEALVNDAERWRDVEVGGIEADAARYGIDFNRLLPGI